MISGRVTGQFTDVAGPHDTVYNAPDGSSAFFKSGVPEHSTDLQTAVEFSQQTFTNVGPGLIATDLFKVTNGRTLLGTTATAAHFNLWVDLTAPVTESHLLAAIPFTIENTPNGPDPQSVNDMYTVTSGPISPFIVNNYKVQFTFDAPASFQVNENSWTRVGNLSVTFTPVPEPSTYAGAGALLMVGLMGFRVLRRRQNQTPSLPAALA